MEFIEWIKTNIVEFDTSISLTNRYFYEVLGFSNIGEVEKYSIKYNKEDDKIHYVARKYNDLLKNWWCHYEQAEEYIKSISENDRSYITKWTDDKKIFLKPAIILDRTELRKIELPIYGSNPNIKKVLKRLEEGKPVPELNDYEKHCRFLKAIELYDYNSLPWYVTGEETTREKAYIRRPQGEIYVYFKEEE